MKKLLTTILLLTIVAVSAMAVPAKRGQWRTITLVDGTQVRAELRGDEHVRFWVGEDEKIYVLDNGVYLPVDNSVISKMRADKLARMQSVRQANLAKRKTAPRRAGANDAFVGTKHALVILAQFPNKAFEPDHGKAKYEALLNTEGYTTNEGFIGSAHDYFISQSGGVFDLQFDVVGPYTMSENYDYYGENQWNSETRRTEDVEERLAMLVSEAVTAAKADVSNWSQYDWNNDNELDQVFILYAGYGEADNTDEMPNTIWPHMYYYSVASSTDEGIDVGNGIIVDTYACGSELQAGGNISGIGTFCHEFSHCMGYPDMYDTNYDGFVGTGFYDLMCSGSYNGGGFCPAGYTSYEKWVAGWLTPIELSEAMEVESMKALSEGGDAYVIYNASKKSKGIEGEYYLLENRQKKGWDAYVPGAGLLVTHIDYNRYVWECNAPNTEFDYRVFYGANYYNDHERVKIVKANNDEDYEYGWPYPYNNNNSLSNTTTPAATTYNKNSDGKKFMNIEVSDIACNTDGTISFKFGRTSSSGDDPVSTGDYLFYESFDQCGGLGGNDGSWNGAIATAAFDADNSGWTTSSAYGGDECARFGKAGEAGYATTPAFTINGTATLTFRAGAWDSTKDGTTLTLSVEYGNASLSKSSFVMEKGEWTDFLTTLTGTGSVKVKFASNKQRFFLDEVLAVVPATGIVNVSVCSDKGDNRIFDLNGRYVGTDLDALRPGIYIVGGTKGVR